MKIITTKEFTKLVKMNIIIINSFLFASLIVTSILIGAITQIPLWSFLITVPICIISIIVFYIKSHFFISQRWIFCEKHESNKVFSNMVFLKYIFVSLFMLIPGMNWIPIMIMKEKGIKIINKEYIACKEKHPKTKSGVIKIGNDNLVKERVEEFNKEF